MMNVTSTDRIEKQVLIHAPVDRVWQAVAVPRSFGEWFGADLSGDEEIRPGTRMYGKINIPGYDHLWFDATVERVEPKRLISWRWHPNAVTPDVDYSDEPTTLTSFELAEVDGDTLLRVVETGFDSLPPDRRAEAFRSNDQGWAQQMIQIERYVTSRS